MDVDPLVSWHNEKTVITVLQQVLETKVEHWENKKLEKIRAGFV